jgi:hypothetical protein
MSAFCIPRIPVRRTARAVAVMDREKAQDISSKRNVGELEKRPDDSQEMSWSASGKGRAEAMIRIHASRAPKTPISQGYVKPGLNFLARCIPGGVMSRRRIDRMTSIVMRMRVILSLYTGAKWMVFR